MVLLTREQDGLTIDMIFHSADSAIPEQEALADAIAKGLIESTLYDGVAPDATVDESKKQL